MAKIYSAPTDQIGDVPDFQPGESWDVHHAREQLWLDKLTLWVKQNGQGELAGESLYFPQGDGQAHYLVYKEKPLQLIHVPLGDAWQFPWAHKLNLTDVRESVQRRKAIDKLFSQRTI